MHDDVGIWLRRGALSVPKTVYADACARDARCCPTMRKTAAVAKPDASGCEIIRDQRS